MKIKELKRVDSKLNKIGNKLDILTINPKNIEKQRARFFSEKEYNPKFTYRKPRCDLETLKKSLEDIRTDDSVMGKILEEQKLRFLKTAILLKNVGKEEFTACSVDLYGKPSEELVEKAKSMLALELTEKKEKGLTSDEILSILKEALDRHGFVDWKIREKDMVAMAAVKPSIRTLYIKKDEVFPPNFISRLITHEIGTHVLRTENGRKQPFRIFQKGFPNYMATEEGLAVVNEELGGYLNKGILRNYVGRVIAVDMAGRGKSFNEIFTALSKNFIAESAFKLATRVKRGIIDTSLPGGLTKDYLYLEGYFKVKEYFKKGGNRKDLYYGKIGTEHVNLLKDIPGIKKPAYLPKYMLDFG